MAKLPVYIVSPMWPTTRQPSLGSFVKIMADGLMENGWTVRPIAVGMSDQRGIIEKIERHTRILFGLLSLLFRRRGLIYIHSPHWYSILCLTIAKIRKMPIVVNIHGAEIHGRSFLSNLFWPATRRLFEASLLIVCPSKYFASLSAQTLKIDPLKFFVSPSGGFIEDRFSPADRYNAKSNVGIPRDKFVLGYVSRFTEGKRWRFFLEIVASIKRTKPNVMAIMIGAGADLRALQHEIDRLDINEEVLYFGAKDQAELPKYYSSMDVFVFTSKFDGVDSLGLVAIEAMASGTPCVARDHPITMEYILDGVNGQRVIDDNIDGFRVAIQTIASKFSSGKIDNFTVAKSVKRFSHTTSMLELSNEIRSRLEKNDKVT